MTHRHATDTRTHAVSLRDIHGYLVLGLRGCLICGAAVSESDVDLHYANQHPEETR